MKKVITPDAEEDEAEEEDEELEEEESEEVEEEDHIPSPPRKKSARLIG